MAVAHIGSLPTSVPSFGAVRLGQSSRIGLTVIRSPLGLALAVLELAFFGPEITAALAAG
jgi:hypothetical protein